jgi:hypothetical protein
MVVVVTAPKRTSAACGCQAGVDGHVQVNARSGDVSGDLTSSVLEKLLRLYQHSPRAM